MRLMLGPGVYYSQASSSGAIRARRDHARIELSGVEAVRVRP